MKLFLILTISFFTIFSNAQIIEFEDQNFKNELLSASPSNTTAKDLNGNFNYIDINHNNEIEISEAENISYLAIHDWYINNAQEINYFINLQDLTLRIGQITSLNLNNLNQLINLNLEENALSSLNVVGSPLLEIVNIKGNVLTNFNIDSPGNITNFDCSDNELSNLDLSAFTSLQTINCTENNLTSLQFTSANSSIRELYCGQNDFSNGINVSSLINLEKLNIFWSNLSSIDVSALTELKRLVLGWNGLTSLNVDDLSNLEYLNLDKNNLTSFSVNQNPQLQNLILTYNELTALNVNNCPDLIELRCENNFLTSFSASNLNLLEEIDLEGNELESIQLENLPLLNSLRCADNNIETVHFENLPSLESLVLSNNSLTEISLDNMNLTDLYLSNNNLVNCSLTNLDNLILLYLQNNPIQQFTLSNLPSLSSLFINDNELTSVNLENLPALDYIYLNNNQLTDLNLTDFPNLTSAYLSHNQISSLQLSNLPRLSNLELDYNDFTTFSNDNLPLILSHTNMLGLSLSNNELLEELTLTDIENLGGITCINNPNLNLVQLTGLNDLGNLTLSSNSSLEELDLSGLYTDYETNYLNSDLDLSYNENLKRVFFKIGLTFDPYDFNVAECPNLEYICTDEFNIQNIQNVSDNVEVNSYCTFTPGGEYYTISGINKIDININGNCEDDYAFYPYLKYNFNYNGEDIPVFSNDEGEYMFYHNNEINSIEITPQLENPLIFSINPSSVTINLPANTNPYLQDFCITPNGLFNDLEVIIFPIDDAIPGFEANYKLIYRNKGTSQLSGNIILNFEEDFVEFSSSFPNIIFQIPNQLNWEFTDLAPFETREINFTMLLNQPTDPNFPLNDGDILNFEAQITPIEEDLNPLDNSSTLNQTVVNSFDPNDKICLEGQNVGIEMIGEFIHYRIRFENTGTANAVNIVVKDVIDTTKFDIQTLTPLNGSHAFDTRITNENQVEFIFENINLPYDDENNDGFVLFKIKTVPTLELNDSFTNQADIYFDYNFPITTEEYTTIIGALGTEDFNTENSSFLIYPNPVENILNINTNSKIDKIEIFDVNQRILVSKINPNNNLNISDLKSGIYFLKIYSSKIIETVKILKK